MSNYLICTVKPWNIKLYNEFLKTQPKNQKWFLVTDHKLLEGTVKTLKPRYVFFPHWSWVIPKSIYSKYECVVFHMTDLPYGRGPEPLQHLILAGKIQTKLTAIRVEAGIDTGPIYMQTNLDLYGSAEEIYVRCAEEIFNMIRVFVDECEAGRPIVPSPQVGEPTVFKVRTVEDCRLTGTDDLNRVYDEIRMQDAATYPRTFIETDKLRFEFTRASLRHDCIIADVKVTAPHE